jgi:hypothetical protein
VVRSCEDVSGIRSYRASGLLAEYNLIAACRDPSLTEDQCIEAQVQLYGEQVVNRINFDRGRIYPTILQAGWSEGVKLRGYSTGGGFETVERHLSILADLDEIAVGITHVATPFPAVIV